MAFGKEIKRIKDRQKLTAARLAEILGVSQDRLTKWMQKDLNPKEEDIVTMERKLGMSVEEIMKLDKLPTGQEVPNDSIKFKDALGITIENQIEILATGRTILSILAELQAPLKKGFLPTQLSNTYRKMVKDEVELIRDELKRKR